MSQNYWWIQNYLKLSDSTKFWTRTVFGCIQSTSYLMSDTNEAMRYFSMVVVTNWNLNLVS